MAAGFTVGHQVMAAMGMTLRVVVPPHPLIGHWLSVLRERSTPSALYGSAMAELGRWLSYEALRDWLPHRTIPIGAEGGATEGQVVDASVPLLVVPMLRAGLGLWQGGQGVVPTAQVAHVGLARESTGAELDWYLDALPAPIAERTGLLIFTAQIASGASLAALLERLRALGVQGRRLRVVTAVAASPGLKLLGERFPELTIYCACIDAELDASSGNPLPGIGNPALRLFAGPGLASADFPGTA
jgi:uracil phosphoribosyltransferase